MSDSYKTQKNHVSRQLAPLAPPLPPHLWLYAVQQEMGNHYLLINMAAGSSLSSSSERPMGLTGYTLFTLFTDKYLVPRSHKVHEPAFINRIQGLHLYYPSSTLTLYRVFDAHWKPCMCEGHRLSQAEVNKRFEIDLKNSHSNTVTIFKIRQDSEY